MPTGNDVERDDFFGAAMMELERSWRMSRAWESLIAQTVLIQESLRKTTFSPPKGSRILLQARALGAPTGWTGLGLSWLNREAAVSVHTPLWVAGSAPRGGAALKPHGPAQRRGEAAAEGRRSPLFPRGPDISRVSPEKRAGTPAERWAPPAASPAALGRPDRAKVPAGGPSLRPPQAPAPRRPSAGSSDSASAGGAAAGDPAAGARVSARRARAAGSAPGSTPDPLWSVWVSRAGGSRGRAALSLWATLPSLLPRGDESIGCPAAGTAGPVAPLASRIPGPVPSHHRVPPQLAVSIPFPSSPRPRCHFLPWMLEAQLVFSFSQPPKPPLPIRSSFVFRSLLWVLRRLSRLGGVCAGRRTAEQIRSSVSLDGKKSPSTLLRYLESS
ncbi:translation initiation factor IF-2-like [Homo sapiens]|uniref:translation initiation factor IF-2-like n=1 Tax=Homo sapiens TaxID=9606 RepID=UPI001FB12212|nr:translation initiation factor IF-2-like [Homo sapiens]